MTNANRLGWRKKLAAGETEQRLWQVDGLPFEWDDEVVKQLLESNFGDITIMSHRRTRLSQNFRFKAASRQEGRNIVPLVAEDAKKNARPTGPHGLSLPTPLSVASRSLALLCLLRRSLPLRLLLRLANRRDKLTANRSRRPSAPSRRFVRCLRTSLARPCLLTGHVCSTL